MQDEIPFPDTELERHAGGLRRLAGAILRDEHAAEDVVQDAWVAALSRPPRAARSGAALAAWLRQVTRRRALHVLRGDRRRSAREELATRPDAGAPADDEPARREVLRAVVEEVLALHEPYQTVLLQRYFQDLPPRAIAARTGTSLATVESRLHRARVLLRERLDARSGGDRTLWAPALLVWTRAPLPGPSLADARPPAGAGAAGSGATLALGRLVATLAATLTVGAGVWLALRPDGEELAAADAEQGVASSFLPAESGTERVVVDRDGSRASIAAPVPADLHPPGSPLHALELRGQVFDDEDQPVDDARVWIAEPGAPWNLLATTDWDGRFAERFASRNERATVYLLVTRRGIMQNGFRTVRLAAGAPSDLRIAVLTLHADEERAVLESLREMRARMQQAGETRRAATLGVVEQYATGSRPGTAVDERLRVVEDDDGLARLSWPPSLDALDPSPGAQLEGLGYVGGGAVEALPARPPLPRGDDLVTLSGTVRDTRGEGVAGTWVTAVARDGALRARAQTRADGSYALHLPLGSADAAGSSRAVALRAGGGREGLAEETVALPADAGAKEDVPWDPVLLRGLEVAGHLAELDGQDRTGGVVAYETSDGTWSDATRVAADGSFVLTNLPPSTGRLLLRGAANEPLVAWTVDGVSPGGAYLDLTLPPAAIERKSVSVSVLDADGAEDPAAEVRIVQGDTGRGGWLVAYDARTHECTLPPGVYDVEAGTLGQGYRDVGRVSVPLGPGVDLGSTILPGRGVLKLEADTTARLGTDDGGTGVLDRVDLDIPARVSSGRLGDLLGGDLPVGAYRLHLADGTELSGSVGR